MKTLLEVELSEKSLEVTFKYIKFIDFFLITGKNYLTEEVMSLEEICQSPNVKVVVNYSALVIENDPYEHNSSMSDNDLAKHNNCYLEHISFAEILLFYFPDFYSLFIKTYRDLMFNSQQLSLTLKYYLALKVF